MKWGCRGHWGHWGCRCSKDKKIPTEDFQVIQLLEFSFMLIFWKIYLFGKIMKCHIEFLHLFCWRLLRPADVTFLKTKNGYQKFIILGFKNYFQTKFYLHISIYQSQFIKLSSMWDTLYFFYENLRPNQQMDVRPCRAFCKISWKHLF